MAHASKLILWALLVWSTTACDAGTSAEESAVGGKGVKTTSGGNGGSGSGSKTNAGSGIGGSSQSVPLSLPRGGGAPFTTLQCALPKTCEAQASEDTGTLITPALGAQDAQDLALLSPKIEAAASITAEQLRSNYATNLSQASPSYDAVSAVGMDALQSTSLALASEELSKLSDRGFVISERKTFPSYVYGLETFYKLDLPLYVSADSILYAIHQSFDSLLRDLETASLIPALKQVLTSMRANFERARTAGFGQQALADADLYLTVAESLLSGEQRPPVAGADSGDVACILKGIASLDGCVEHQLFGVSRVFDFSQFTIRGHYTASPELQRYFQAMMWLGRVDLRLIETQTDGTQRFHRRQLEAALALRALLDETSLANWQKIDRVVSAFVGEHDSMILPQLDALLKDLNTTFAADVAAIPDAQIAQAILDGRYGTQRIASHIMVNATGVNTDKYTSLPLSSSFLLFGQRYVVDSHVFSNVVFDRVLPDETHPPRMLPNPLDVAFAALGNDQAVNLLGSEISNYGYAPQLTKMRLLVDAHPEGYWSANLYNHWLGALRALSTAAEARDPAGAGLPFVAGTEAWGRRLANTQLASWSELRHDTLLYAKQSYTTGFTLCEYPDAYVEPYPAFWSKLVAFAEYGKALVADLSSAGSTPLEQVGVGAYFERLRSAATILMQMAERQRTGAPHDPEHIAFINQAVKTHKGGGGCGGGADAADASGWYADLFYSIADKVAYDPNIADVHTQPTDEVGNPVGRILHVGTGMPRMMVVTAENCSGLRAYVGLVSSYFERVTDNFKRFTDEEWADELLKQTPSDVPWMADLVLR